MRKIWRHFFAFFVRNTNYDALIGWSCWVIGNPEPSIETWIAYDNLLSPSMGVGTRIYTLPKSHPGRMSKFLRNLCDGIKCDRDEKASSLCVKFGFSPQCFSVRLDCLPHTCMCCSVLWNLLVSPSRFSETRDHIVHRRAPVCCVSDCFTFVCRSAAWQHVSP